MSTLTWIVLGLIVGFIANKLVNKTGEGVLMTIVLGVNGMANWFFIERMAWPLQA